MKNTISKVLDGLLFIETLFLLIFIPLFPKIPILDVKNTWVYIRAEDFVVVFVILSWILMLLKRKVTFKTPITIPILIFWLVGGVATIHAVLLVFPTIANIFPNVAFLSLVRHVEYMSLFFIAYHSIKDKNQIKPVVAVLVITLLGVVFYGFGQKYAEFPAYLTMNEEFAKGVPIQLSQLSRVPSTFAGHYDLAAYLVLIIPILASLFFGFKNWFIKIILLGSSLLGFVLLFMTVSRVSFFVLFASLFVVLFIQKRKLILLSIPLLVVLSLGLLSFQSSLFDRFKSTVSEVDVVVDAKTGESLGHVKFVPKEYFSDKIVLQKRVKDATELAIAIEGEANQEYSTSSAILPYRNIPEEVPLVSAINISTGENLPQGTGYVNLYLSPVTKRLGNFFYELPPQFKSSPSAQILVLHGDFIVKRASAYDLSFTTRFQGEWPRAIDAFKNNILIGSGYGSVSLAVDNNYLRILGEIGLLGFMSFFVLFLSLWIYIRKIYPDVDSSLARSFIVGFGAGVIGLSLNAVLIDVFEASKIAFLLWILIGITFGILSLYQKKEIDLLSEIKKIATSTPALITYLFFIAILLYTPILNAYFVGDDFTWLRWITDCRENCSPIARFIDYFKEASGFFYRPGTKIYFYIMNSTFWLNQVAYHFMSILLHFTATALFFVLAKKVFQNKLLAFVSAGIFLIISGSTEAIFWISSTGFLFNAVFGLAGLILFIEWEEKKKTYLYVLSLLSMSLALLFHELGVIIPLLVISYWVFKEGFSKKIIGLFLRKSYLLLFTPTIVYLILRLAAQSHWFNGDYGYNLIKLPLNFVGNLVGYGLITIFGPMSLNIYELLRSLTRGNIVFSLILIPITVAFLYILYKYIYQRLEVSERRVIAFGLLFFTIALLPFLGLGNITSRYSYFSSIGLVLIMVLFIKKTYQQLLINGREIALGLISVLTVIFVLFHIIQVQQSYFEWQEAGTKAKRFFISLEGSYNNYWSDKNVEFHFVNVPLRVGEAWVFPVGLDDAVWFAFRNDNAKIYKHASLDEAISAAGLSRSKIVLKFNEDGSVTEIDRFKNVPPDLITP